MDVTRVREQKAGHRAGRGHKKQFSNTADRTHKVNTNNGRPMRGGIRL